MKAKRGTYGGLASVRVSGRCTAWSTGARNVPDAAQLLARTKRTRRRASRGPMIEKALREPGLPQRGQYRRSDGEGYFRPGARPEGISNAAGHHSADGGVEVRREGAVPPVQPAPLRIVQTKKRR